MNRGKWNLWLSAPAVLLLARPESASACAVCFGAPDSPLTKGMAWGIMSLLAIIGCVLGGLAAFFIYLARKAAAAQIAEPTGELATTTNQA